MWDFETEPEFQKKLDWMETFVRDEIEPLDLLFHQDQTYNPGNQSLMAIMKPLKQKVRDQGLWACHLPKKLGGDGYGQVQLALMNEILGRSFFASTIFGTQAPDTGNAEALAHFGTEAQKAAYLQPLLDGDIVSCFTMTEPQGGADPGVFQTRAYEQPDGSWRIRGQKWYASNARWASFFLIVSITDPDAPLISRFSMFVVPAERAGIKVIRNAGLMFDLPGEGLEGYIEFEDLHVTREDLLGDLGQAFAIAQHRLGGGRVHHAMRSVGLAKKAFDAMCERALSRTTKGSLLADKQSVQHLIADCWLKIEQFRLFVLRTAWKIDRYNDYKAVREDIAACKNLAYEVCVYIVEKAIHLHGSLGASNEMAFGEMMRASMCMGIVDGPAEVHQTTIAKQLLRRYRATDDLFPSTHVPPNVLKAMEKYKDYLDIPGDKSVWVNYFRAQDKA